ncbi:hypothetical protein BC936DRAFT_149778 [Jimgerdemannia flammicorona]|uniref:DUF221-domain-containing protein n=2 Tax=Jimgerdemannia flammicorona TaxID=994334 RepID=A0A433DK19_9FUNG|nr:hypothetical protein BC936DRAFT_149778 [Jimgerdemannia flammicorona]
MAALDLPPPLDWDPPANNNQLVFLDYNDSTNQAPTSLSFALVLDPTPPPFSSPRVDCSLLFGSCNSNDPDPEEPIPGTPPHQRQNQSSLGTQLVISIALGMLCFLAFCTVRIRFSWLFAPRLNLKRHAPERLPDSFFGWIIPLIKTPHSFVLERVGLDAVVMLQFFVMAIKLFAFCSVFGVGVLYPIELAGGGLVNNTRPDDNSGSYTFASAEPGSRFLVAYLIFTYVFSFAAFYFMFQNYRDYVRMRRRYCIRLAKTLPSRTVMVQGIPPSLRTDKALAEYYEGLGLGAVESTHVVRHLSRLTSLVRQRAEVLKKLERAYAEYWGNPCSDPAYDPDAIIAETEAIEVAEVSAQSGRRGPSVDSHVGLLPLASRRKERPTIRTGPFGLFGTKVDAIDYLTHRFNELDEQVVLARRSKGYDVGTVGFVTFEEINSATIATQTLLAAEPFQLRALRAPEPRDVYWPNITLRGREQLARDIVVNVILVFLVFFWAVPVGFLSTLTSIKTLKRYAPWLLKLAKESPVLENIIQGFLPTLAVVLFMNSLPMLLEGLSFVQGLQARSDIEEATLSKYFFFLLFNVLLVFTVASTTFKTLEQILNGGAAEIVNVLATTLPQVAPFFVNYTVLQGMALLPMQLLLLGNVVTNVFLQLFLCKTPREYAEARAPWQFNYGFGYPPPLLIFIIVLVYSTISSRILVFGTIYFAVGYLVYKYQLLYVYFHPYESAGRAWPIIFPRIIIGMIIFQLTMAGLLLLKKDFTLGVLCIPLVFITFAYKYGMDLAYDKSSKYLPLQTLREELGKEAPQNASDPGKLNATDPSTVSASNQNLREVFKATAIAIVAGTRVQEATKQKAKRKRPRVVLDYDDYEADPDDHTDFKQPPITLFPGILNTGLHRYGHPALVGVLPQLWLPIKAGASWPKSRKNSVTSRPASNGKDTLASPLRSSNGNSQLMYGATNSSTPLAGTTLPAAFAGPSGGAPEPAPEGQVPEPMTPIKNPEAIMTFVGDTHESSVEQGFHSTVALPGDDGGGTTAEEPQVQESEGEEEVEDENDVHRVYYHHPERMAEETADLTP